MMPKNVAQGRVNRPPFFMGLSFEANVRIRRICRPFLAASGAIVGRYICNVRKPLNVLFAL